MSQITVTQLVDVVYDYVYKNNPKGYRRKSVTVSHLADEDNVRLGVNDPRVKRFVNEVFGQPIQHVGQNNGYHIFDGRKFRVFVDPLGKHNEMNARMSYLLSDLSVFKKTSGLLVPVCNMDVDAPLLEKYKLGLPQAKVYRVSITERYSTMMTIGDVLEKGVTDTQCLQIIHDVMVCLAAIQDKYPRFRHNKLGVDTVYCYEDGQRISIKLYHYEEAVIGDLVDNPNISNGMKTHDVRHDMVSFLESLGRYKVGDKTKHVIEQGLQDGVQILDLISLIKNNMSNNNIMDSSSDTYELHSASDNQRNFVKGVRRLPSKQTFKPRRTTDDDPSSSSSSEELKKSKDDYSPDDLDEISTDMPKEKNVANVDTPDSLDDISSESEIVPKKESKKKSKKDAVDTPATLDDISSDDDMEMQEKNEEVPINRLGAALGVTKEELKRMANTVKPGIPKFEAFESEQKPYGMPNEMSPSMMPTYMPPGLMPQGMMGPGMMPPGMPPMPGMMQPEMQGMMPQGMMGPGMMGPGMMPQGMMGPGMMPQGMMGPGMMGPGMMGGDKDNFFFNK